MATYNRQSILASFGNLPVAPAGRTIHPVDADSPNVNAGELFIESNGVTIGLADIPTASDIKIGIGVGPVNGPASEIRYVAGEDINLCDSNIKARVSPPVCGSPQVVDVFFNGCINCKETYSFAVNLDDSYVRSHELCNGTTPYIFTQTAECCADCDDCNTTANCADLVCKFVDQINGKSQKDPSKITRFLHSDMTKQYQPFGATRLFLTKNDLTPNTTRTFCLDPTSTPCENCGDILGITGISLNGVVTPFQGTTLANNTAVSKHSHIKSIVSQINKALEPLGGHAFYKHGIGKCCSYTIEINSCVNTILLVTAAGTLAPCDESNPFTTFNIDSVCQGCGVTPDTVSPTCGLRIFVDPVEVPCDCAYPPNLPAPNYYGRTVDVQAVGDAWECQSFFTNESSAQILPEGFGYFWQDLAHYGQHRGGSGRDFRYNNKHRGDIGLPDDSSRAKNAAKGVLCEETYCVYNLNVTTTKKRFFNNALTNTNTDLDYVLIPQADTVTKLSWEPILTALQLRGVCQPGSVVCP